MSRDTLKKLKMKFQDFVEKNKTIQESIEKTERASKDTDVQNAKNELLRELDVCIKLSQDLQNDIVFVQEEIGKKEKAVISPTERKSDSELAVKQKNVHQMSPEEQEITYELKSRLIRSVDSQNKKLQSELTLQGRMGDLVLLNQRNRQLQEECQLSRTNAYKLVKMFEKKAKQADSKLEAIEYELKKSQELAQKYKNLYELELQTRTSRKVEPRAESEHKPSSAPKLRSSVQSTLSHGTTISDIIRKNEILLSENDSQWQEIQRLKRDNTELLKKTKCALCDRDQILHQLKAMERSRDELLKHHQKEKVQCQLLSKSLTKQTAEWITAKRQLQREEENRRLNMIGPVSPHEGEQRLFSHLVTRNIYTPRKMFPVTQYATANKVST